MAERVSFSSPYYPYEKVISGAVTLKGAEYIPNKLLYYLLDLPDSFGYVPVDDNERPRVRLAKYIYYDDDRPLDNPLPSPKEKLSILFDPQRPDINTDEDKLLHPKGYRLFMQRMIGQSQLEAQTLLKCYIGRIFEAYKFETIIGLNFEVWTNVNLETNTKTAAYDRSFAIEQCLHEALDGVNIAGIGTISFARYDHSYNGSEVLYDSTTGLGRLINCSLTWEEGGKDVITDYQPII